MFRSKLNSILLIAKVRTVVRLSLELTVRDHLNTQPMDLKEYYNNKSDYVKRRDFNSFERKRRIIAIDCWKNFNFVSLFDTIPTFQNIVEIGCSIGDIISRIPFQVKQQNRYGIDISDENIETAGKLYPQVNFFAGSYENFKLHYPKLKIDLVIMSDIIEHIQNDTEFLTSVAKSCNYILLNLPLEKSLLNINREYGFNDSSGHLRWYSFNDAKKLINNAGLIFVNYRILSSSTNSCIRYIHRERLISKKQYYAKIYGIFKYVCIALPLPFFLKRAIFGSNLFALLKPR